MSDPSQVPAVRLMRKLHRPETPVDRHSVSLFRLGEQCNNDCPMCSNSGREEAFFQSTEVLVSRVGFLAREGFRRVVVTGGEPTIHPGFWEIISALGEHFDFGRIAHLAIKSDPVAHLVSHPCALLPSDSVSTRTGGHPTGLQQDHTA